MGSDPCPGLGLLTLIFARCRLTSEAHLCQPGSASCAQLSFWRSVRSQRQPSTCGFNRMFPLVTFRYLKSARAKHKTGRPTSSTRSGFQSLIPAAGGRASGYSPCLQYLGTPGLVRYPYGSTQSTMVLGKYLSTLDKLLFRFFHSHSPMHSTPVDQGLRAVPRAINITSHLSI